MTASTTIKLRGGPPWTRRRRIGHYGGALDKRNTSAETTPHAWSWVLQLRAHRGSAYTHLTDGLVHAENLAIGRFFAGLTRSAERYQANSNPLTAYERLDYWSRFLAVPVSIDDTPQDVRVRCAAKYGAGISVDATTVDASIAKLLGDNFVRVWRRQGSSIATPPLNTFWPVINPGPSDYSLGGGAWISPRASIVVETQKTVGQTDADFLRVMNVDLPALLDPLLGAHATWDWATGLSDGGITLGSWDLGFDGLAENSYYAKWEAPTPEADGTFILPPWITYTCATSGTTAQTSASTLRTGFGANDARAFSRDGSTWGLLVEPGATNLVVTQDFNSYSTLGAPELRTAVGPDGSSGIYAVEDDATGTTSSDAERIRLTGVAVSLGATYTASGWIDVVSISGAGDSRFGFNQSPNPDIWVQRSGPTGGWEFGQATGVSTTTAGEWNIFPALPNEETGVSRYFGLQFEERAYSTSFVDGTRAVGSLSLDTDKIAPHGYFDIEVSVIALGASSEIANDIDIVREDADTICYLDQSDLTFKFKVDGSTDLEVGPVTWSRYDTPRVRARHSPAGMFLEVTGCTTGNGNATGAAQDYLVTGDLTIWSGASGATEGGAIRAIYAHEV